MAKPNPLKADIARIVEACIKETGGRPSAREIGRRIGSNHVTVSSHLKQMDLAEVPVTVERGESGCVLRRPVGMTAKMIQDIVAKSVADTGRRPANRDIARAVDIGESAVLKHLRQLNLTDIPALPPKRRW